MNIIGTALERSKNNQYFNSFLKLNPSSQDNEYDFKCWILKRYFKQNILIEIAKLIIGIILLVFVASSSIYKIFGTSGVSTVLVVTSLVIGIALTGTGIMFSISNYRCLKNFKDFLWDDEEEENEIVSKLIKFYKR
ncbi:MAG: hypothetical protein PUJ82_01620 [Spirochaetales bacterium]|nr:hypothetical protein [Spirochaetales bacterium]MDY5914684.1 hypothetical protein [Treponema sp.]